MLMQILQRTPPWVFLLFAVLVYFGIVQSRTRQLTMGRVTIVPVVLIGLSLSGIWSAFGANLSALAAWAVGAAAAVALNQWAQWPRKVSYAPETRTFLVEGSWLPLAVMMLVFFTRYVVTVLMAMQPGLAAQPWFPIAVSLAYGLMSGAFLARALRIRGAASVPVAAA